MGSLNLSNYFILILCAGMGKRMKSLGSKTPKSILKKNGNTLISHIISQLKVHNPKKIYLMTGYKDKMIVDEVKKNHIEYECIYNKNFNNSGSVYSWYLSKKEWEKKKQNFLLIHADIFFDKKFLLNILKSKHQNIIGVKEFNKLDYNNKKIYITSNRNNKINKIGYGKELENKKIKGQILCINKFSKRITKDFFSYCEYSFLKKKNKALTWEILMNRFIIEKNKAIYSLPQQNFYWFNVNTQTDYNNLLKFKVNE